MYYFVLHVLFNVGKSPFKILFPFHYLEHVCMINTHIISNCLLMFLYYWYHTMLTKFLSYRLTKLSFWKEKSLYVYICLKPMAIVARNFDGAWKFRRIWPTFKHFNLVILRFFAPFSFVHRFVNLHQLTYWWFNQQEL